jgi:ankyrin repeat protein
VEGLLDAVPIDRQYISKLFKLNKRSLAEARWIYENIWSKNQRDDIHNFLYGSSDISFIQCIEKGWLISLTKFNLTVQDVRSSDNYALRNAARGGHLETVKYLVETFNLTVQDVRSRDNEALRYAAYGGHLETVRYLIETFNLTVQDVRNNEALRWATSNSRLEVVRYLLEKFYL